MQLGFSVSRVTDKKVHLNTDLLKPRHEYLYRKMMAWLKLNEIRSVMKLGALLKMVFFNKGECSRKGDWGSVAVRRFLWRLWKFNRNSQ
jgi:hypothetical protein